MKLPKLAIENYQFTIIVVLLLVLSGIVSFMTMPRSEDPPVAKSGASVIVIYPGANPADLENLVANPIEEALNELDDIKEIGGHMQDGLASIYIEFNIDTDPDEKYSEVVQKVNSIRSELPQDIFSLDLHKWEVSDVKILQLALVSPTASYQQFEEEAERLKNELKKISDVRRVETWAYPDQQIRVAVNLDKLAQTKIPIHQVIGAIQSASFNIPGGHIDIGSKKFNIQTSGSYQSLDDIRNTIIHSDGTKVVFLKDVADVFFGYEDLNYHARFNGQRAVFITVNQKEHTNIFGIMDQINEIIPEFEKDLPEAMKLTVVFDQSKSVANRLNEFFTNLLEGIVLVGVVIFLSLSFRASMIVMWAIPVSILIGIGFVDMNGYGLQQMSIAGLVIVLGILVDNAIVVTENISRFLKMGHNHFDAAVKGTNEIAWAIVSATATTVLAFVPMMMLKDITGDFIRSMPVTVVITLTASLLVALTFTPYLSNRFLKTEKVTKENRVQRLLTKIIESPYRKTLNFALNKPKLIVLIALIAFVISLAMFPVVGVSFFPKAEKPQFFINIDTPDGSSLDKTNAAARYVESVLEKRDEIERYAVNIGRGNPRVYYNVIEKQQQSTHSQIFVQLKRDNLDEMTSLIRELRHEFSRYPDAEIEIEELEQGPPVEAPIAIKIIGENLDVLKEIALDVEKMVMTTEGTININNPLRTSKTDLHVNINRAKAAMLGVRLVDVDQTVRTSIAGMAVANYTDTDGEDYDIVVRLPVKDKPTLADFDKIHVTSAMGEHVPLKQIASIEFKSSPQRITHFNLERSVTVSSDVLTGFSVDKLTKQIIGKLDDYELKKGYRFYIGGELESREESFGGLSKAILIAMIGIFGILVLQFKSFSQPLIVFSAIPLAIIGSIWALLITGYSFSFTAFVGLTSLVGIVVNNSIILVDYVNKLRENGEELITALKIAGETRFRPIILTTGTTIGGLLPLTLQGGTLWAPMGWTIIGGLLVSTALTLIVVPVLYKIYSKI